MSNQAEPEITTFVFTATVRLWLEGSNILVARVQAEELIRKALRALEQAAAPVAGWDLEARGICELDLTRHSPRRG